MSQEEFIKWQIMYAKLEPFGEYRADLRAGYVASPIVNALRDWVYKDAEHSKVTDWVLEFRRKVKKVKVVQQSWQQIKSVLKVFTNGGN